MKELVREWVGSSRFHITPPSSQHGVRPGPSFLLGEQEGGDGKGCTWGLEAHQETVFNKFGFLYCQHTTLS